MYLYPYSYPSYMVAYIYLVHQCFLGKSPITITAYSNHVQSQIGDIVGDMSFFLNGKPHHQLAVLWQFLVMLVPSSKLT